MELSEQKKVIAELPCYYCGEPTGLFSPHAVRKHLDTGIPEFMCKDAKRPKDKDI